MLNPSRELDSLFFKNEASYKAKQCLRPKSGGVGETHQHSVNPQIPIFCPDNSLQNQTEGEAVAGSASLRWEDRGSKVEMVG